MGTLEIPRLREDAAPDAAVAWLGDVVFSIGPGFHPDTPAADYINLQTNTPTLDEATAQSLDTGLDTAFSVLGTSVYDMGCWYAWRLHHGLPKDPVYDERTRLLTLLQVLDANGEFTDEDAFHNGWPPMTLDSAKQVLLRLLEEPTT